MNELKYTIYHGRSTVMGFIVKEDLTQHVVGTLDTLHELLKTLVPNKTISRSKLLQECKNGNWDLAVFCSESMMGGGSHIWLTPHVNFIRKGTATAEELALPTEAGKWSLGQPEEGELQ